MKKLGGAFLLTIALIAQVQAANYTCTGENNETLAIKQLESSVSHPTRNNSEVDANVVLTSNGQEEVFEGLYNSIWDTYELTDGRGNSVDLKVVKPISHGGRCGRCFVGTDTSTYYAKLTVNQQEKDFTCTLTN